METDCGERADELPRARSLSSFGIVEPLAASASGTVPRARGQTASDLVALAPGLRASIVTRSAADATDMIVLWPDRAAPTHLITCVETDRERLRDGRWNPGVQRIELATGHVETILRGTDNCDGIRGTPWGTILATEEASDGSAYELIDPLTTTNHVIQDRAVGLVTETDGVTPSTRVAKRPALPTIAWEGLTITPQGVVYAGDELSPGDEGPDTDGGSIYKLIPSVPFTGSPAPIQDLAGSPLVSGSVHALQVSCSSTAQQLGQGCEVGNAAWVSVRAATARADARAAGATGYYRPEDMHRDPAYIAPPGFPDALRFCWNDPGEESAKHFGEMVCAEDLEPLVASPERRTVTVSRFVEGDPDFNTFDNLAFQPRSGIPYVVEDHENGDIFACLPDGEDRDIETDGCIRVLSVADRSAEPTGFVFDASGQRAYLSIQHSEDEGLPPFDDYPTDDVIVIEGFEIQPSMIRTTTLIEGSN